MLLLSKLVFIPFLFLLVCFTYLSSLVFKLSKSSRCLQSEVSLILFHLNIPDAFKVGFLDSFHFSIARVAPEVAS